MGHAIANEAAGAVCSVAEERCKGSRMNKEEILIRMAQQSSCAILISSGALTIRGLLMSSNDLDLIVSPLGFSLMASDTRSKIVEKRFGPCVQIGPVEASTEDQLPFDFKWELVEGFKVQTIGSLLSLYNWLNRGKDQKKIELLRKL